MSTLSDFRTNILAFLQDSSNIAWTNDEIDAALRQAIREYSQDYPCMTETVITCLADGREIALNELDGLIGVADVWWPYDSDAASETWPPNRVKGWRLIWDNAEPVLFLSSKDSSQPQQNDEIRIWYFKAHTITNLDSESLTTIPHQHERLVCLGAAGFAAASGAIDRAEVIDPDILRKWGYNRLSEFRRDLEGLRASATRNEGEPYGDGWKLDKWSDE